MKKVNSKRYVADDQEKGMTVGELSEILKNMDPDKVLVGYDSDNTRAWLIYSVYEDSDDVTLNVFETD